MTWVLSDRNRDDVPTSRLLRTTHEDECPFFIGGTVKRVITISVKVAEMLTRPVYAL
jgi:hypothetical protein